MNKRLFIFAGEKSGDLLGGSLLKKIKEYLPGYLLYGVGGQEMQAEGLECLLDTKEFEMMGFSEILWSLSKLWKQFYHVRDHILSTKPGAVVLIDYPGFNLRMAKALRKRGYRGKLIQYISPTVWAWGKHRAELMANTFDLLLTIYPFEAAHFSHTSLNVKYIGNPIKEIIQYHQYHDDWAKLFGIKETENLIAIFPGSRKAEILLNLPFQLKVAEMLKADNPETCFAISCAHEKIMPMMHHHLRDLPLKLNRDIFLLPKTYTYELMRDCRSAIAKSGTVTLELALHQCPTVVIYKLSLLNRLIAQYALRINLPHYCIVNILSGKTIYPELIERGLSPQNLYREIKRLNDESSDRTSCIKECQQISTILEENDASVQGARAIAELIS